MNGFKLFLESESEEEKNVKEIISKLPKSHQKLLKGFKITFTPGNTLKGDNQHIGYIHKDKIVVAAPFHHSRSMTFCHEVSHLVWEKLMTPELKKEWHDLLKRTKKEQIKNQPPQNKSALNQNDEEVFAMVYATTYIKNAPITYTNKEWQNFIKRLP